MKVLSFILFLALTQKSYSKAIFTFADDEDKYLTVPQIIKKYGYPCEEYQVITPDDYVLTLHHIPHPPGTNVAKKNQTVFLMHGLLSSSADWIMSGPEKGLAYILSREGYDIWMGNARGNKLSRAHLSLNPETDGEFWKFSWEEIGMIDVPAMIDFVLEKTKRENLIHIGHSQGTTSFYVMTTMRPEYNAKIKAHFSLAPITFMSHMTSPILKFAAFFTGPLSTLLNLLGVNEFLPNNEILGLAGDLLCGDDTLTQVLCTNVLFALCGFSPNEMNATMLPMLTGHTPAGSSTKQIVHYGQEISSGHFRRYDYGLSNLEIYGRLSPPDYDLKKVTAPVYLFYSHNDWLAAEQDVLKLYKALPNVKGRFLVTESGFNHLDYMYGIHAPQLVYNKVISLMGRL